ncbi:hypothetical protein FB45DRAFT_1064284 [Roridomyces roridus]|uniref:F-box domain-containing protein n=1 Tax=Roridomyces roridus TaxID=1738132 RepID=A0AAD7BAM5_9AGAR|nr:hypothetical protein FB45DRAFT_1064284 [Roridomyces roridus]
MQLVTTPTTTDVDPNAKLRTDLAQIRAKIAALESQLVALREEERRVSTALDSIVYPILTLPLDITSEIFTHYLDPVCSQWRSIALASPGLWPALHTGKPTGSSLINPVDILRSRLARVGGLPLWIDTLLHLASQSHAILPVLAPYFPQLLNLSLEVEGGFDFPCDPSSGEPVSLPSLTELDLRAVRWSHGRIVLPPAPHLREASLHELGLGEMSLPWNQLTTLTLHNQSMRRCRSILRETPNLTKLHVTAHTDMEVLSNIVRLDRLRALTVNGTYLLLSLVTPALESLEIQDFHFGASAVERMIIRSSCTIRSLHLHSCATSSEIETVLTAVPTLRALVFSGSIADVSGGDWELLLYPIAVGTLLPAMESLEFRDIDGEIPNQCIARMLSVRGQAEQYEWVRRIKSFKYIQSKEDGGDKGRIGRALADLAALRAQGMEIELEWGPKWLKDLWAA